MAELPNNQPHRKRLKRHDEPNQARFLTFSCFQRQPFLRAERTCRWFVEAMDCARVTHGFDIWAYVIMPEHVHLIVYPGPAPHRMADFLYTLKKSVTNRALSFVKLVAPDFLQHMEDRQPNGSVSYRFWQRGGGYDENLYTPGKLWDKIDYIHNNPVRRGLCDRPIDWPWSSARAFESEDAAPLRINLNTIPLDDRRRA